MPEGLLYLELDTSVLKDLADNFKAKAAKALRAAAGDLAAQTHAEIIRLATEGLHARRQKYIDALSFSKEGNDVWLITLDSSAVWIDDGLPEGHQMLSGLLSGPKAKTNKKGEKYLVVPFNHGVGPVNLNSEYGKASDDLKRAVQDELHKRKIPFAKLERNISTGEYKIGKLHDIEVGRGHPTKSHEGIGQGQGAVGQARQGHVGDRYLDRIRIYQRQVKGKNGRTRVVKGIMTFRTASSKQDGSTHWVHPGSTAKHFFEQGYEFAERLWEKMVPGVLADITG